MKAEDLLNQYNSGERHFQGIDLKETDLINVNPTGCNFSQADLRQARLGKSNFSHCNLTQPNLRGAALTGTILTETDLREALMPARTYSNLL